LSARRTRVSSVAPAPAGLTAAPRAAGCGVPGFAARGHLPALDGIRALAVFLVLLYHFGIPGVNGGLGVEIFFTLSGFLITWLLLQEVEASGRVDFRAFYLRRTLRIFPAMYVYLLFGLAVLLLRGHPVPWGDVLASALYLQNYYDGAINTAAPDTYLSHTWSLAIEEQFYLLWPLVLYLGRRDLARLAQVLMGLIVAVWLLRSVLILGDFASQRYLYRAFESRMDQLAVGCLLAVQLRRGVLDAWAERLAAWPWLPALTLAALIASSLLHGSDRYRFTVGFGLEALLTAVLIVQLVRLSRVGPWRWFNAAPVAYLGRISYSLYLYHPLLLFTVRRLSAGLPVVVQLALAIAVAVAFASASYFLVERRFRAPSAGAA
jgi:peptidoglycan/LPS O-acetylase OafA/YrhL